MDEGSATRREPSVVLRAALWLFALCGVILLAQYVVAAPEVTDRTYVDLQVYREAASAWLSGGSAYDGALTTTGLLYTYPPVSLLLFAPLAQLPLEAAVALSLGVSLLALLAVVALALRAVGVRGPTLVALTLAIAGAASVLEPVWATLALGQVNLVLVAVVLADATVVGARWRGLLTGVAASVKLTPLVVLLYYAWRRDWAAVRRLLVAFAAMTLVGLVVAPHDTWRFFTQLDDDANRAGETSGLINQSLRGLVGRVLGESTLTTAVWIVLVAAVLALLWRALQLRPSDAGLDAPAGERELLGLVLVALAGLLVSPVSWSHHWVWGVPLAIALLGSRRERWGLRWTGALVVVALFSWRFAWDGGIPLEAPDDPWVVLGVGSTYVGVGLLVLVLAAFLRPVQPGEGRATGVPS